MNELFNRFPGLENYYENLIQQGFQGTPEQALQEFITSTTGRQMPSLMPQAMQQGTAMGAMPQTMPPAALPLPQTMVDPTVMAYQRGLLSGSVQPQNPYGFGLATSPYYGYPRNPYGSLLY